jgi:hypothetical protein
MTRHPLLLCALPLITLGCGGGEGENQATEAAELDVVHYEDVNALEGVDVAAARAEREARVEVRKSDRPSVSFGGLRIDPDEPTVESSLRAEVEFRRSEGSYADFDIAWYVNDVERVGIRSMTLDSRSGRFKSGDVVSFVVSTLGPTGVAIEAASKKVYIGNSTPEIVTRASGQRGLDGLHLKAEDADGDPISWAIKTGPPGVSIGSDGRVRVRQVDLAQAYDGEVVITATDPQGARAEFHVPVKINAAVAEKKAERKVSRLHTRETMSAAEFEKANLDNLDRVEGMSTAEFEAYTKKQEDAADKRRK